MERKKLEVHRLHRPTPPHPSNVCTLILRPLQTILAFSLLALSSKWLKFKMENSSHTWAMTNFPKEF